MKTLARFLRIWKYIFSCNLIKCKWSEHFLEISRYNFNHLNRFCGNYRGPSSCNRLFLSSQDQSIRHILYPVMHIHSTALLRRNSDSSPSTCIQTACMRKFGCRGGIRCSRDRSGGSGSAPGAGGSSGTRRPRRVGCFRLSLLIWLCPHTPAVKTAPGRSPTCV